MEHPDPPANSRNQAQFDTSAQARFRILEGVPRIDQPDVGAPLFKIPGLMQRPMQRGAHPGPPDLFIVRPAHKRRIGVKDKLGPRGMLLEGQHKRLDLGFIKVKEKPFGQEKERPLAQSTQLIDPGRIKYRTSQMMVTRPFIADEFLPKLNNLGKIKVIPNHLAIVDALEPCIETRSQLDNNCLGILGQKRPRDLVEIPAFQDHRQPASRFSQFQRLLEGDRIQLADNRFRPQIPDQRIGALRFKGPQLKRDV